MKQQSCYHETINHVIEYETTNHVIEDKLNYINRRGNKYLCKINLIIDDVVNTGYLIPVNNV